MAAEESRALLADITEILENRKDNPISKTLLLDQVDVRNARVKPIVSS
jgi:hypothetical protein